MKIRWHVGSLLLACMIVFLTACGADTPTATPVPPAPTATTAPVAAPTDTTAPVMAAPTDTTAPVMAAPTDTVAAAEAPTVAPTETPGPITLGTGAAKIEWWHISTADDARTNWQNLASTYVKDHPNVSIEITVLENEAFKAKLATAMQSGNPPDLFQSWGGGVLGQYARGRPGQDLTADAAAERLG